MIEVALPQERSCSGYEAVAVGGSEDREFRVQTEMARRAVEGMKKSQASGDVGFWGSGSGEAGSLATVEGKRSLTEPVAIVFFGRPEVPEVTPVNLGRSGERPEDWDVGKEQAT